MRDGLHLGTLAGIPIRMRASFLVLLGLVLLSGSGPGAVLVTLLTFGSVVLHELGHALVGRRLGVRTAAIELHFLGGAALLVDPPRSARDEIAIALAGPVVSLVLAAAGLVAGDLAGLAFVERLGWINLALGVFNLLPALPMDGGRVLRALLARRLGYGRATEIAVQVSRALAVVLAGVGLATGALSLVLIAGLVWMLGTAERRAAWTTGYRDAPADGRDGSGAGATVVIQPRAAIRPIRIVHTRW